MTEALTCVSVVERVMLATFHQDRSSELVEIEVQRVGRDENCLDEAEIDNSYVQFNFMHDFFALATCTMSSSIYSCLLAKNSTTNGIVLFDFIPRRLLLHRGEHVNSVALLMARSTILPVATHQNGGIVLLRTAFAATRDHPSR